MLIENYLALNLYSERNRFFHLGMSYSNFPDNRMIQLLHTKTSQKDNIWLAGQIGPLNAGAGDLKAYQDCAQIIFEPFVERYGLQGGRIKVKYDLEKNEVQVGYLVGKVFLILGISKKLDEIDFRTPLIPHFKGKYFTNKKMIGFLGSTNEGDNYNPSYCGPP